MRSISWFTVLIVIAVAGVQAAPKPALAASPAQATLSQQVAGGGVTVTATLLKDQAEGTGIKLSLNTHSVNLNEYQLDAIATLRDDSGRAYPIVAVEKANGGGHHREALLRFGKVDSGARGIELTVRDVAGVKERIFRWSLTE